MSGRFSALLAATTLFISSTSRAQTTTSASFNQFYDALRESTVATLQSEIDQIERARNGRLDTTAATARAARDARSRQVAVRAPSLSTANATTAAELAQAAISTSVSGTDAGVSLSPLALMGYQDSAVQVPITFAALKDGVARLQVGLTEQFSAEPEVNVLSCKLSQDDEAELRKSIEAARSAYDESCKLVSALTLPLPGDPALSTRTAKFVQMLHRACGTEGEVPKKVSTGISWLMDALEELQTIYESDPGSVAARDDVSKALLGVRATGLKDYKEPAPDECPNQAADALGDAALRASWNLARKRIGLSLRGDFFQRVYGFNPDPSTPLSDGRLKDGELRAEASYARRDLEIVAGIGYGTSRTALADELVTYVSPSVSIAWTAGSLSGDSLYKDGEINLIDGALPPRLVIGLDAQLQYAPSPPATQVVNLQKVVFSAYLDFRFTDKVVVRLGVPITADLALRKGDASMVPAVPDKRDRQWTLPFFVATVIKL
jgi:hypothetical protein